MESTIFWDAMLCSPVEVHNCFREMYLQLHGQRIGQGSHQKWQHLGDFCEKWWGNSDFQPYLSFRQPCFMRLYMKFSMLSTNSLIDSAQNQCRNFHQMSKQFLYSTTLIPRKVWFTYKPYIPYTVSQILLKFSMEDFQQKSSNNNNRKAYFA
jgi:hypothetical protein